MNSDREQAYSPDFVSADRIKKIEDILYARIYFADIPSADLKMRVRHNKDFVKIPKGKIDITADIQQLLDIMQIASKDSNGQSPFNYLQITRYHVDELSRLNHLIRMFINAQDDANRYQFHITSDDDHTNIALLRFSLSMIGASPSSFMYQRGDFRDAILSFPNNT